MGDHILVGQLLRNLPFTQSSISNLLLSCQLYDIFLHFHLKYVETR